MHTLSQLIRKVSNKKSLHRRFNRNSYCINRNSRQRLQNTNRQLAKNLFLFISPRVLVNEFYTSESTRLTFVEQSSQQYTRFLGNVCKFVPGQLYFQLNVLSFEKFIERFDILLVHEEHADILRFISVCALLFSNQIILKLFFAIIQQNYRKTENV